MSRSSTSRMSLLPRQSLQSKLVDGMERISLNDRRTSKSRSSIYGKAVNPVKTIPKDPRPLRDKSWLNNSIRSLIASLVQMGYPNQLSPKQLTTPSQKEFFSIFQFLYSMLDPNHNYQKKFEEELPGLLKALRYPFAEQINKSHLMSVASLQTWPVLLACLLWLVDLIVCCDQIDNMGDLDDIHGLDEQEQAERIFFDYLKTSYNTIYMHGSDDYDRMDAQLYQKFDKKNDVIIKQVDKLKKEFSVLEKEWNSLVESEPPLIVLERERTILQSDFEKYQTYVRHLETKLEKLESNVEEMKSKLVTTDAKIEELYVKKQDLQNQVDLQEISPADVERMNAERDQLVTALESCRQNLDDINKRVWQGEITLQKTMDRLEKSVQEFNTLLYKLNPSTDAREELELNISASNREEMVSIDLIDDFKPKCVAFIAEQRQKVHSIQDEIIQIQEQMDSLAWNILQKQEQVSVIKSSVDQYNTRYQEQKHDMGKQLALATSEFSNLSKTIEKTRLENAQLVQTSVSKLNALEKEYASTVDTKNQHRDKTMTRVVNGLVEVFEFHSKVLDELEQFKRLVE